MAEHGGKRAFSCAAVVSDVFVAYLLSVYLLAVPAGGYSNITVFKYALFMSACGIYAALMLFFAVRGLIRGRSSGRTPRRLTICNIARLALCAFLLFSALSAAFSPWGGAVVGGARREGLLTVAAYVVTCLLVSRFSRPAPWMLWMSGISVSLFCVLSLVQFSGADPLGLYPAGTAWAAGDGVTPVEFFGTVGNADLSVAVLCASAGAFFMALFRCRRWTRLFLLVPMALAVTVILKSGVEAGKVALAAGVLLSLPVIAGKNRRLRRAAAVFAAAVIVLFIAVLAFRTPSSSGILYEASELLHGRWNDSFGSGRIYIWRNCLKLFTERPLFGGGPDTLGSRDLPPFVRWDPEYGMLKRSIDAAHNEYLNILVNQGFFALVSYLSSLIAGAVHWYRPDNDPAAAAAGGAVLFYSIQAFFGISMCLSAPYMWLALGILLRAGSRLREDRIGRPDPPETE
ncbi:MAG: O-antigen ligase family protein [Oscillospiraceae bacterium]|nr:O-antigen ligase family protein [Oscillospiraceae bacterium]